MMRVALAGRNGALIVYGGGGELFAAAAPLKELAAILRSEAGRNTILQSTRGGWPSEVCLAIVRSIRCDAFVHATFTVVRVKRSKSPFHFILRANFRSSREQGSSSRSSARSSSLRPEYSGCHNVDVSNLGVQ